MPVLLRTCRPTAPQFMMNLNPAHRTDGLHKLAVINASHTGISVICDQTSLFNRRAEQKSEDYKMIIAVP